MWRETTYEDLHRIEIKPAHDIRETMPDTQESRDLLKRDARTWEDDGKILAIVGIGHMWQGVGQVWTMLTDESRERGVMLTRGVLRFLDALHEERGYWRIQATVESEDEHARLWIRNLGFEYEGIMVAYGPDMQSHAMYSRLRL